MLGWSKLKHERFTVQVWQEWHGTKSVPSILTVLIDAYWCNIYSTISLQVFRCSITSPAHRYQHGLIRRHKRLPFLSHYEVFRNHWVFPAKLLPLQAKWENSTGYKTRSSQVPSSFTHQMQLQFFTKLECLAISFTFGSSNFHRFCPHFTSTKDSTYHSCLPSLIESFLTFDEIEDLQILGCTEWSPWINRVESGTTPTSCLK